MKNQTIIRLMVIALSVLIKCYCIAQTPIAIYTPKGSLVSDTYVIPEFTQYQIDSANAHYCNTYPNATKLADASRTYNCHGYAWHFSEGVGQPVWIGWHYQDMQSIYWSDGSYIESSNQLYPAKVRYVGKDHSAIATNQPDIFISKWRNGPLMKHHKDYCPYKSYSSLKYYIKNPFITGPTVVCSTSDYAFTVNNFYPGSTISWSAPYGQLQKVSSSGNTAVFRGLTGASGPGTIQAVVTTQYGQVLNATYSVWVGTPSISNVTGPRYTQVGASTSYCATIKDAGAKVTSYNWSLMPGTFNNYFNPGGLNCYITWYRAGEYVLQVNAQNNECGTGATYYYPVTVGLGGYLSLSPNPASGNVQASVIKARDISTTPDSTSVTSRLVTSANQDLVSTYTVRVYNNFGTLLYSTKKSGNEFTIPVNNLTDGTYIIEANDGKESYKQQLIVKH